MPVLVSLCLVVALLFSGVSLAAQPGAITAGVPITAPRSSPTRAPSDWPYAFALPAGAQATVGIGVSSPGLIRIRVGWEGAPLAFAFKDPSGRIQKQVTGQRAPGVLLEQQAAVAGVWSVVIANTPPAQGPATVARGQVSANFPFAALTAPPTVASGIASPNAPAVPAAPGQAISAAVSAAPAVSQPTQPCTIASVVPPVADVGDRVTLTGSFGPACVVHFNIGQDSRRAPFQIVDAQHLTALVPTMASGQGTIGVVNPSMPLPLQINGHSVPFEIKVTSPVLQSLSPTWGVAGVIVTVHGQNLRQSEPYTAHFIASNGKRFDVPIQWLNATTFRVVVPDIRGNAAGSDNAQHGNHFYVRRGNTPSNLLAFQPLVATVSVTKPAQGDVLTMGNAYDVTWAYAGNPGSVIVSYQNENGCQKVIARSDQASPPIVMANGQGRVSWPAVHPIDDCFSSSPKTSNYRVFVKTTGSFPVSAASGLFSLPCKYATCGPWQVCTDVQVNAQNCGQCGNVCSPNAGYQNACVSGKCQCQAGLAECYGPDHYHCVNLKTDVYNCGSCGRKCDPYSAAPHCVNGACMCRPPSVICPRLYNPQYLDCVDLKTSTSHCGSCGKTCPSDKPVCSNGTCTTSTSNQPADLQQVLPSPF